MTDGDDDAGDGEDDSAADERNEALEKSMSPTSMYRGLTHDELLLVVRTQVKAKVRGDTGG
jgi:hypothetical protein